MNFPGPQVSALFERVQRLHRHNLRRGRHSAEVLISDLIYAKAVQEFRFAPMGWMIIGLPVRPANVPGVTVTKGMRHRLGYPEPKYALEWRAD